MPLIVLFDGVFKKNCSIGVFENVGIEPEVERIGKYKSLLKFSLNIEQHNEKTAAFLNALFFP